MVEIGAMKFSSLGHYFTRTYRLVETLRDGGISASSVIYKDSIFNRSWSIKYSAIIISNVLISVVSSLSLRSGFIVLSTACHINYVIEIGCCGVFSHAVAV